MKLKHDELLSSVAFNFNFKPRHYSSGPDTTFIGEALSGAEFPDMSASSPSGDAVRQGAGIPYPKHPSPPFQYLLLGSRAPLGEEGDI